MMSWTAIVRFLTMVSLVLAPVIMMGGAPANASPVASPGAHHSERMSAAHCAEMGAKMATDGEDDGSGFPQGDCLTHCAIACAATAPVGAADLAAPALPRMVRLAPLVSPMRGLTPETTDPPPRIA
jgi:hypothetical protein